MKLPKSWFFFLLKDIDADQDRREVEADKEEGNGPRKILKGNAPLLIFSIK